MIERHAVTDRESWLALRKNDVTASAVGALFGAHPYTTALELYEEKRGLAVPEFDTSVLRRGRLLESAVGIAVEEDRPEWKVRKAVEYLRDPDARIGATPDFYIDGDPRGLGVLQAKTVAPRQFREQWAEGPPFWIILQNTVELMLEPEAAFGAVAALVIDPYKLDVHIFDVPRHPGAEGRIRETVAQFWADFAAGKEPEPDFARDADLVRAMYPAERAGVTVDLTGDNYLPTILEERETLKAEVKTRTDRLSEIETEIKFKIGDAEAANVDGWRIGWKAEPRKGYTVAPSEPRILRIKKTAP